AKNEKELPKEIMDLRRFMPVPTKKEDGTLSITHIMIPIERSPHAMRRVLQVLIRSYVGQEASRETIVDNVFAAEDKIIKTNIEFYETLIKDIEALGAKDERKQMIAFVAQIQLNKLYKYMYNYSFFDVAQNVPSASAKAVAG
ncbi:MAG: hypothetical protein AAF569_05300, partial [Pseudomonadota bacterium]